MIFYGLDIGSGGCKSVAFSEDGVQLTMSYREYQAAAGHADMEPGDMFASILDVLKECTVKLGAKAADVAVISITSFGESFVPIDKDGNNLSKIIMYTDKRGIEENKRLVEKIGHDRIIDVVCTKPDSMYSLPKAMWVMNNVPNVRENVWKFLLMTDYAAYKLSGETKINYSLACRTMAFDVEKRIWSDELLNAAGITSDNLSEPVVCGSIIGNITRQMAEHIGLPYTTKIMVSAHDQISAAIGAGALDVGEAVDGTGSVECITPVFDKIIRDKEFSDNNFVIIPHSNTGLYATYAFNFAGGVLLKWFRDCFASNLKEEARAKGTSVYHMLDLTCPAEPTDVIVIPHFLGAGGTPDMVANAKGTITGMTMNTALPDIYRAVMEGLTFEMLYNIEKLNNCGIAINSLRATGGGAKSPVWLQIKADIFGIAITPLQTDEAGAAGCSMLAAVAMGKYKNLKEAAEKFVKTGEPYFPSGKYKDIYKYKYEKFKAARNSLLHLFE